MIYKKGRGHRVLVCPNHGVLATNGWLGKIGGGILGTFAAPGIGTAAGAALGDIAEGAITGLFSKKTPQTGKTPTAPSTAQHGHLTAFEKALLLERMEH